MVSLSLSHLISLPPSLPSTQEMEENQMTTSSAPMDGSGSIGDWRIKIKVGGQWSFSDIDKWGISFGAIGSWRISRSLRGCRSLRYKGFSVDSRSIGSGSRGKGSGFVQWDGGLGGVGVIDAGRMDEGANKKNRDVVRPGSDLLHNPSIERGARHGQAHGDLARGFVDGDVDEVLLVGGGARGLEEHGDKLTIEGGGQLYNIFLEYVPSGMRADHIKSWGGRVPEADARRYARSIVQGLSYVHEKGYWFQSAILLLFDLAVTTNADKMPDYLLSEDGSELTLKKMIKMLKTANQCWLASGFTGSPLGKMEYQIWCSDVNLAYVKINRDGNVGGNKRRVTRKKVNEAGSAFPPKFH
ncbi:hypothetical protein ACLOJK_012650 [Asimina triloba]